MNISDEQLLPLIEHLSRRREAILLKWKAAVHQDDEVTAPLSLSRAQFRDHIPEMLQALENSLRKGCDFAVAEAEDQGDAGSEHGIHRWQQGYNLHEVMREWGHLDHCLVDEIEIYADSHPEVDRRVIGLAHRTLTVLFSQGISQSTLQFVRMQQAEAAAQARDLAMAVREGQELQKRQAEILREATHDLRGQLGIVTSAADLLNDDDLPRDTRGEFMVLFQKALVSQQELLNELMDLARLQAGQEKRDIETVDIAMLLRELGDSVQPLARERELFIRIEGPESLIVECDPVRVRRIAQNLLLNAIKYTDRGGVTLGWGDSRNNDSKRWMLFVEDTGPGFHAGPGGPLATALKEATEESNSVEPDGASRAASNSRPDPRPERQRRGEGIGLSIVKRLCELLDASVEMESEVAHGTIFRVILPRHYSA
ncbi:sensor histidine kinase [Planctomicrobium piriforme]|uniref:sensor histidine kinase n=1 Tax=Planctomicrobium piriforme TaxID=1576369 RepID=UPI001587A846|nr:sensor histidine kinase [Planctomicrobium piriforme]